MALSVSRILKWPLWGVLVCGVVNSLLWERGAELFRGHPSPLLFWFSLIILPIIGGFVTTEKPLFTAFVFAFGCIPPVNDMPPMSIGLWPFYWTWAVLFGKLQPTDWYDWLKSFLFTFGFTGVSLAVMSLPLWGSDRSRGERSAQVRKRPTPGPVQCGMMVAVAAMRIATNYPGAGVTAL
jgi:hypothetical protein